MASEGSAHIQMQPEALAVLLDISRRAREAGDHAVLRFMAVNDSHALAHYRQAAMWLADGANERMHISHRTGEDT